MTDRVSPIVENASGWSVTEKLTAGGTQRMSTQIKFPEADVYTVQFNIQSEIPNGFPNPEAVISWKVEGNVVDRLISAAAGMSLSGVGQSARIMVYDNSQAVQGFDYNVTALISRGSRASNMVPPMYFPVAVTSHPGKFIVGPASTRSITIPQNQGLTSVQVTSAVSGVPGVITQADVTCRINNVLSTIKEWFPDQNGVWIPIPPSAQTLELVNTSANTILFGVAFGVDG